METFREMIEVNIIHLKERVEREELYKRECTEQGICHYKVWEGIKNSSFVQTGICQSHKQIIKDAKNRGLQETIIMEDDVKFTSLNAFNYALDNKPKDYDAYFMGISGGDIDEINKTVIGFSGLFCYMVHERFYDIFLEADEGSHLDRWLSGFNNKVSKLHNKTIKECLGRNPVYKICYTNELQGEYKMPAITYNGYSDNFGRVMNYDKYWHAYKKTCSLKIST